MKHVAVGILISRGMVLACQRKKDARYPLKWEFPGGKIEPGETPERALERELHEELDIEATVGPEFHVQEWSYRDGNIGHGANGSYRVTYFIVQTFGHPGESRV